jgi:hydroxyacylglutathione hydrolase
VKYRVAALLLGMLPAHSSFSAELIEKVWNHGSKDCSKNLDPAIEVFRFDSATYILRQNKCVHFEAPFIYVLFGTHTVFVQDTGATADPAAFPLYDAVQKLVAEHGGERPAEDWRLLVTHSHSHSDHTAADPQFRDKPGVTLIEPNAEAVRGYFGLTDWPEGTATIDLGARELVVMPIPGHQGESIAVYDPQTGWLLTGDSLYPGRLYVRDWKAYRASIQRLVEFSKTHRISAVMGTHVEMSRTPGKDYPPGSTFQPDETGLALTVEDLLLLDEKLHQAGSKPKKLTTAKFVVTPVR